MKYLFIFIFIIGIKATSSIAQTLEEQIDFLMIQNQDTTNQHVEQLGFQNSQTLNQHKKSMIFPVFWVYKNYISSQDSQRCGFHPSCSVYSIQSIKKNGLIIGFLDGFDRLTRCNGSHANGFYKYLYNKGLYEDQVE